MESNLYKLYLKVEKLIKSKRKKKHAKQRKKGRKHDTKDLENKGGWEEITICGMEKNV